MRRKDYTTSPWRLSARTRREDGQTLILFVLLAGVLIGFLAFAIDVGVYLHDRRSIQNGADASALAGATQLPASTVSANQVALTLASDNGLGVPGDTVQVTFSATYVTNDTITVSGSRSVPFVFGKVLGLVSAPDSVQASAVGGVAGSVVGVIPWAVNNDVPVPYGNLATLQSANAGGGNGQFNFVSITPQGGQSYANAMANGVTQPIVAGHSYPTNTFDGSAVSAETAAALNARITARPAETWQTAATGSPRVVFAPVLNGGVPNAPTPVTPSTFRAFFLDHVDQENSIIWVRPVKATAPVGGTIGIGIPDTGVHLVKLIK